MFKRTVLQHIAEDLLITALGPGAGSTERVVPLQRGTATPLVALPTDSPLLFLYEQLGFAEGVDCVSREDIQAGLQRLGTYAVCVCVCVCTCFVGAIAVHCSPLQGTGFTPVSCTVCWTSSTQPTPARSVAPRLRLQ